MKRHLVFVHGRAQENKDSVALKAEWIAAFRRGLDRAGLSLPIAEADIRFPYYGDTLASLVAGDSAVAEVLVRGRNDAEEQDFIREVLEEVQAKLGVTNGPAPIVTEEQVRPKGLLNWGWVLAILRVLDGHVPGASAVSIALATADVYQYLRNPGIRDKIEVGVRAAMSADVRTVVVSHSLGTVVAYNLLRREGEAAGWRVPLHVTLGSPLGVTAIRRALNPIQFPKCVANWFNARDPHDVVALYALDAEHFGVQPKIVNKTDVFNATADRHGIGGYLDDPEVAQRVHDALVAP